MAAQHENTYTANVNIQQLMAAIRDPMFASSLDLILRSENPTPPGVWYRFHHGTSFASWGEKITITLTPIGPTATQLHIHSECGMPTQVVDWGKNKQLVNKIYTYLSSNVMRYAAPAAQPAAARPLTPPPAAPQPGTPAFCSACGTPLVPGARFCSRCGTKI